MSQNITSLHGNEGSEGSEGNEGSEGSEGSEGNEGNEGDEANEEDNGNKEMGEMRQDTIGWVLFGVVRSSHYDRFLRRALCNSLISMYFGMRGEGGEGENVPGGIPPHCDFLCGYLKFDLTKAKSGKRDIKAFGKLHL